jgi:DNA-binding LacI/PurR family transcriptional regulator
VLDGRHDDPRVSFVDTDNVAGAYTAVSHLIRSGRRQIATADPPLTTVRQSIQRRGVVEVETLIDMLRNGLEPPRRLIVPAELVIRASCGAGKPASD